MDNNRNHDQGPRIVVNTIGWVVPLAMGALMFGMCMWTLWPAG